MPYSCRCLLNVHADLFNVCQQVLAVVAHYTSDNSVAGPGSDEFVVNMNNMLTPMNRC